MMWGSNLFHVGILAIFAGHFVGLLTPVAVFDALGISHTFKQLLAMTFGGVAGVACWIGIALLAHGACSTRAFATRRASATSRSCCCCGCS